jgi:transposase-like protein
MTYQEDFTLPIEYLEQISEQDTEFLPELIRILVNAAMQIERQKPPDAGWHEQIPERQGDANGFKPKTVQTRVGGITFDIPQV